MLCLKVNKKDAEKLRSYLASQALLELNHIVFGTNSFIYLPIKHRPSAPQAKIIEKRFDAHFDDKSFAQRQTQSTYRKLLKKDLGKKYEDAIKSYDIIGDIALIDASGKVAKSIAKAIIESNSNIKTVISKHGAVSGKYRTRKYVHVLGKKNFVANYKENGALFEFDIRKTFFSSRLAYDRLRIAKQVRPKENVMVMFAGMGPFAIQIAKMQKGSNVVGIELNKSAYTYMKRNVALNKLPNMKPELGDVKKVVKKYKHFADRIIMPLPKSNYEFLGAVLQAAKKKCIVHYYAFGKKESAFEDHKKALDEFFKKHGKKMKVLDKRVVRTYSPQEVEVVLDIMIG